MGFMPGKRTVDAFLIIRDMMEKYEAGARILFMVFVGLWSYP